MLVHSLTRAFAHATQDPYRLLFDALRRRRRAAVDAETSAAADQRALDAYRDGRACHPLLPYADWASCQPVLARLGRVIVAGSRDAIAARALGFVPSHSVASALEMTHGVAGGRRASASSRAAVRAATRRLTSHEHAPKRRLSLARVDQSSPR